MELSWKPAPSSSGLVTTAEEPLGPSCEGAFDSRSTSEVDKMVGSGFVGDESVWIVELISESTGGLSDIRG